MAYSDDSPQRKAALASGKARRRRAAERRATEERRLRQLTPGHHVSCRCDRCLDAMVQFIPSVDALDEEDAR